MLELLTHHEGELALFNMFTAFGTPQDITLASLRVDQRFAAGQATQAVFKAQVVQSAPEARASGRSDQHAKWVSMKLPLWRFRWSSWRYSAFDAVRRRCHCGTST